jgi:hypothetical protein
VTLNDQEGEGATEIYKRDSFEKIRDAGGIAEIREIDALDGKAVEKNVDEIVMKAVGIDISFDLIDTQDVQGKPTVELSLDEFLRPIHLDMRTHFLTTKAASRHMIEKGWA